MCGCGNDSLSSDSKWKEGDCMGLMFRMKECYKSLLLVIFVVISFRMYSKK